MSADMDDVIGVVQFHAAHGLRSGDFIKLVNASPHILGVEVLNEKTVALLQLRWYHRLLLWLRIRRVKVVQQQP